MVSTLMNMDTNIEKDIDQFITGVINSKKPPVKVEGKIPLIPVQKNGQFTTAGSKINEIYKLFKNPYSYKMEFGGEDKMYFKAIDGDYTKMTLFSVVDNEPIAAVNGQPITFNFLKTDEIKSALKMAGDKVMNWSEKSDFDYFLNNVNIVEEFEGADYADFASDYQNQKKKQD